LDLSKQLSKSIMRAIGGIFALFYSTIGMEAAGNMIAVLGPTGDARILLAFELGIMALGLAALGSAVIGFVNILRARPATDIIGEDQPLPHEAAQGGSAVVAPASATRKSSSSPRPRFGRRGR